MLKRHHVLAKVGWFEVMARKLQEGAAGGPWPICHLALCSSSLGGHPGLWKRLLALMSLQGPESMAAGLVIKHVHCVSHVSMLPLEPML